jgi:hypothetical protein
MMQGKLEKSLDTDFSGKNFEKKSLMPKFQKIENT